MFINTITKTFLILSLIPFWNLSLGVASPTNHYESLEVFVEESENLYELRGLKSTTEIEPLSDAKADEIFHKIATMKDLKFNCPYDGCYARSHLISQFLIEQGLIPQKIWIFAQGNAVRPKNTTSVSWIYHVAPLIMVQNEDGTIENKVIDPSVYKAKPLTIDEWLFQLQFEKARIVLSSHLPYKPQRDESLRSNMSEQDWQYCLRDASKDLERRVERTH